MLGFRNATIEDFQRIVDIEVSCFPEAEAASSKSLKERIVTFPEGFLVARLDNEIIGFINGAATNRETIVDPMFESMAIHHVINGDTLAIYGVDIHPDYQGNGYSRLMMEAYIKKAKQSNRKKIILTCKKHLVEYYSSFGYVSNGLSKSSHGGAKWFDMTMNL